MGLFFRIIPLKIVPHTKQCCLTQYRFPERSVPVACSLWEHSIPGNCLQFEIMLTGAGEFNLESANYVWCAWRNHWSTGCHPWDKRGWQGNCTLTVIDYKWRGWVHPLTYRNEHLGTWVRARPWREHLRGKTRRQMFPGIVIRRYAAALLSYQMKNQNTR
jgi:hypothetical protein